MLSFFLLAILLIGGCGGGSLDQSTQTKTGVNIKEARPVLCDSKLDRVVVYYLTKDKEYLVPVTATFNPTREVAKIAVEKLLAGPEDETLEQVFPRGVKLRQVFLSEKKQTVYVDLTEGINKLLDRKQAELAVKALVLTMTELKGIDKVQIMVNGSIVPHVCGVQIDKPLKRPDIINELIYKNQKGVQVFFNEKTAQYLVPVTVPLPAGTDRENLPLAAVQALLTGPPSDSGLLRTIWPGTELLGFDVKSGIAKVNLSKQAIGYGGGSCAETSFINSLLFTLTQFKNIDKVEILIEGKTLKYLPEGTEIEKPLVCRASINNLNSK
ncbi:MAG: germination protein [Clostridia bacterium]|nr:germination protein [Clostridia bacterium]